MASSQANNSPAEVPKRLVFFLSGFDPAGTGRYHLMMRQQHRYYARRFGVRMTLGPFEKNERPASHFSHFTIDAEWPEGKTTTHYYVSDWEMEVQREAARSNFYRFPRYLYWYARSWVSGVFPRIFKRQPRAGVVFSLPFFGALVRLLLFVLCLVPSYLIASYFTISNAIVGAIAGISGYVGFLAASKLGTYFKTLYEPHLADSLIFQCRLSDNNTRELEMQATTFSREIVDIIENEKPDEVYLVGHSCGCFHSLPAHEAILKARRSGEHHSSYQVLHITFGSLLPYTTIYKKNRYFRELAVALLEDEETDWIEYFAPQDPFSVPYMRLDRDYGFELTAPLPAQYEVRSAVFSEVFAARKIEQFKYNPLRMHFQYLTANDVAGAYDYFYIITHPNALKNRLHPPRKNDGR